MNIKKKWRDFLCKLGYHGPNWFGPEWGRCNESFVRECPNCGMRWYGTEIEYERHGTQWRGLGDWKTRAECIHDGEWVKDKFPGQKY